MSNSRKPTALKKLQGTFRPARAIENEMSESLESLQAIPEPPDTIQGKIAKTVWYSLATELMSIGVFYKVSLPLLEMYCNHYELATKAKREINKNGIVKDGRKNPSVSIFKDASAQLLRISNVFGFTPASASSIKIPTPEKATDPWDEI